MNKVTLIGRLADVKGRVSKTGSHSTVFQIVVSESYKDSSGIHQKIVSNFFPVLFGKRAEGINNSIRAGKAPFKKGHLVSIEATVRSNSYVTANGETKHGYDFIIDNIQLLSRTLDEMIESRNKYQQSSDATHVSDSADFEIITGPTGQEVYNEAFEHAPAPVPKAKPKGKAEPVQSVADDDCPFA